MLYKMLSGNFISLQVTSGITVPNQGSQLRVKETSEANILNPKQTLFPNLRQEKEKKKKELQRHSKHLKENWETLSSLVKKRHSHEITPELPFFLSSYSLRFVLSSALKSIIDEICQWFILGPHYVHSHVECPMREQTVDLGVIITVLPLIQLTLPTIIFSSVK